MKKKMTRPMVAMVDLAIVNIKIPFSRIHWTLRTFKSTSRYDMKDPSQGMDHTVPDGGQYDGTDFTMPEDHPELER